MEYSQRMDDVQLLGHRPLLNQYYNDKKRSLHRINIKIYRSAGSFLRNRLIKSSETGDKLGG